jgi:hypothetical protein
MLPHILLYFLILSQLVSELFNSCLLQYFVQCCMYYLLRLFLNYQTIDIEIDIFPQIIE